MAFESVSVPQRLTHCCRNCQKMDTVHIDGKCPFESTDFDPMNKDELEKYNAELWDSFFKERPSGG